MRHSQYGMVSWRSTCIWCFSTLHYKFPYKLMFSINLDYMEFIARLFCVFCEDVCMLILWRDPREDLVDHWSNIVQWSGSLLQNVWCACESWIGGFLNGTVFLMYRVALTPYLWRRCWSQVITLATDDRLIHTTSAGDLEAVHCFLHFLAIKRIQETLYSQW